MGNRQLAMQACADCCGSAVCNLHSWEYHQIYTTWTKTGRWEEWGYIYARSSNAEASQKTDFGTGDAKFRAIVERVSMAKVTDEAYIAVGNAKLMVKWAAKDEATPSHTMTITLSYGGVSVSRTKTMPVPRSWPYGHLQICCDGKRLSGTWFEANVDGGVFEAQISVTLTGCDPNVQDTVKIGAGSLVNGGSTVFLDGGAATFGTVTVGPMRTANETCCSMVGTCNLTSCGDAPDEYLVQLTGFPEPYNAVNGAYVLHRCNIDWNTCWGSGSCTWSYVLPTPIEVTTPDEWFLIRAISVSFANSVPAIGGYANVWGQVWITYTNSDGHMAYGALKDVWHFAIYPGPIDEVFVGKGCALFSEKELMPSSNWGVPIPNDHPLKPSRFRVTAL